MKIDELFGRKKIEGKAEDFTLPGELINIWPYEEKSALSLTTNK